MSLSSGPFAAPGKGKSYVEYSALDHFQLRHTVEIAHNNPIVGVAKKLHFARNLIGGISIFMGEKKLFKQTPFMETLVNKHFRSAAMKSFLWEICTGVIPYTFAEDEETKELVPYVPEFGSGIICVGFDYGKKKKLYRFIPDNNITRKNMGKLSMRAALPGSNFGANSVEELADKDYRFFEIPSFAPNINGKLSSELAGLVAEYLNTKEYEKFALKLENVKVNTPMTVEIQVPSDDILKVIPDVLNRQFQPMRAERAEQLSEKESKDNAKRATSQGETVDSYLSLNVGLQTLLKRLYMDSITPYNSRDRLDDDTIKNKFYQSTYEDGTMGVQRLFDMEYDTLRETHLPPFRTARPMPVSSGRTDILERWDGFNRRLASVLGVTLADVGSSDVYKNELQMSTAHTSSTNAMAMRRNTYEHLMSEWYWALYGRQHEQIRDEFIRGYQKRKQESRNLERIVREEKEKIRELRKQIRDMKSSGKIPRETSSSSEYNGDTESDVDDGGNSSDGETQKKKRGKKKRLRERFENDDAESYENEISEILEEKVRRHRLLKQRLKYVNKTIKKLNKFDKNEKGKANVNSGVSFISSDSDDDSSSSSDDEDNNNRGMADEQISKEELKKKKKDQKRKEKEMQMRDEIEAMKAVQVATSFTKIQVKLVSRNFLLMPNFEMLEKLYMQGQITPEVYATSMQEMLGIPVETISPDQLFKQELNRQEETQKMMSKYEKKKEPGKSSSSSSASKSKASSSSSSSSSSSQKK